MIIRRKKNKEIIPVKNEIRLFYSSLNHDDSLNLHKSGTNKDYRILFEGLVSRMKRFPLHWVEYSDGRILVLDGILQTSEKDEFVYHEMICHTPIFLHKDPKRVLIIGGGDGGSLEEVLKHKIEEVRMVEIDKKVIEVSRKYIPSISKGITDLKR